MKRAFDTALSFIALIVFCLPMVLIALIIRFSMGGPVFFKQERPGYRGRPFIIRKFRTMSFDRDSNGKVLCDTERLTGLGKFMRRYSLDELPQLINVLKGDLSFVGPRPLLMEYLPRYSVEQARRHEVKPGITGWAQVNGRNAISWEEKFKLDVWYVDHQSFSLDMKIIWLTLIKVLKREGISANGHATMPEFTGSNVGGK
ncbi:MAG TPA: sugar transferase [Syntrophorhabdaceae bacterium]|nr:sugar transferase [Syntrophorhabdaceae bacterium]